MEKSGNSIDIKYELKRKMIHISSLIVPLSYYYIERKILLIVLLVFSVLMLLTDVFRHINQGFGKFYRRYLGDILRDHENAKDNIYFTGGTYIVFSFFFCVLLFQKEVAILSMMIVVVCDTAAAISGKTFGKHKIGNKTIEGSTAFFITALILFFAVIRPSGFSIIFAGILSALLTTAFELVPLKADDNITIPLFFGIVYSTLTNTGFLI